eukprot:610571-Heterocapsa_arctica.AAC.1
MVFPLRAHATERSWNSRCCAGEGPCKLGVTAGLSARSHSPHLLCPSPAVWCPNFLRTHGSPRAPVCAPLLPFCSAPPS